MGAQFSGILLEEEYYELIRNNTVGNKHVKFISAVAQIPLKARAFIELGERKAKGQDVKDDEIKKHRNDVLVLSGALTAGEKLALAGLPRKHLEVYLTEVEKLLGDQGIKDICKFYNLGSPTEVLQALREYYF